MAREIIGIRSEPAASGARKIVGLMMYRLRPDQQVKVGGQTVAVTPADQLPPEVAKFNLLQPQELRALNDGTAVFEVNRITLRPAQFRRDGTERLPADTIQSVMDKAKDAYPLAKATFIAKLRQEADDVTGVVVDVEP